MREPVQVEPRESLGLIEGGEGAVDCGIGG